MQKLKTLRVDRETGHLVPNPTFHRSAECSQCQKGDRFHALLDWEKALEVHYYEPEPRIGPPFMMGLFLGIFIAYIVLG